MLHYRQSRPHPLLQDAVRCYYELRGGPPSSSAREGGVVPDGHLELAFDLSRSRADWDGRAWTSRSRVSVDAVMRTSSRVRWTGEIRFVAVKLTHGIGLSWLGLSVQDVEHEPVDGASFPELNDVADRIEATTDWPSIVRCLDDYFLARRSRLEPDAFVTAAAEQIRARSGGCSVGELAEHLGVSRRTLQTRVGDRTGLTPKQLAQVVRIREAIRRIGSGSVDFGRVAHDLGFYDQSHFIRDFRRLAGRTPTDFFSAPQFVSDLLPSERPG